MGLSEFASTPSSARPSVPSDTSRGLALGLKILNYLRTEGRAFSLGELVAYTRLGKPSLLRLLRTLEGLGYVSRDANRNYCSEVEASVTGVRESLRLLRKAWGGFSGELQSRFRSKLPLEGKPSCAMIFNSNGVPHEFRDGTQGSGDRSENAE
jgi:hypothetical protein